MISWHPNKSWVKTEYAPGWRLAPIEHLADFPRFLFKCAWSPIIWNNHYRREPNFARAYFAVFDFDEDVTIEDAKRSFSDVSHLIATTKSHQKEKQGKPPCDRFRVVVPFSRPITDLRQYRYTMMKLCSLYGSDQTGKDGARFFWPCAQVVEIIDDLDPLEPLEVEAGFEVRQAPPQAGPSRRFIGKKYPAWAESFLSKGVPLQGSYRNQSVFRIAKAMSQNGVPYADTLEVLSKGKFDRHDFSDEELESAVRSAYK